jgi:hypothetical protein
MSTVPAQDEIPTLKGFLLAAILWLPLAFFLWFLLRSFVVYLPIELAAAVLKGWMPTIIERIEQEFTTAVIYTKLPAVGMTPTDGQLMVLSTDVDALLFCYGWAVLVGLIMATPMSWGRTFAQLAIGGLVLVPAQAFGIVGATLLNLGYNMGDNVRMLVEAEGASQYLIAFWYQLGYLILPPVTPVVVWIMMNRRFIEAIAAPFAPAEPGPPGRGPSAGPNSGN